MRFGFDGDAGGGGVEGVVGDKMGEGMDELVSKEPAGGEVYNAGREKPRQIAGVRCVKVLIRQ